MALVRGASVALVAVGLISLGACAHKATGPQPYTQSKKGAPEAGLGVNSYLWRASLETLAFMPLASADPYGGVINTDWYTDPQTPNERFKITVYILDTRLRADGLTVNVAKEVKGADGAWTNSTASAQTQADIENAILTKARQLRLSNIR
jgi:hypothetical protein